MTSKPKAEARGVWIVETRSARNPRWTPLEIHEGRMSAEFRLGVLDALANVPLGREYRIRRYIPAKTTRPAKRKR